MKFLGFFILFIILSNFAHSQSFTTISGKVIEASSEEVLIGASVYVPSLKRGVTTNQYGFFSLKIPSGIHEIVISFVGHNQQTITLNTQKEQSITVRLEGTKTLEEVIVRGQKNDFREVGVTSISIAKLKEIPTVLGESDVLKALAFTPGVTKGAGQCRFVCTCRYARTKFGFIRRSSHLQHVSHFWIPLHFQYRCHQKY